MASPTERAARYADQVLAGEIPVCKWVRLACERFLADIDRAEKGWDYHYDPAAADRAVAFMEKMPHVKGVWASRREKLRFEDWQCFIECNLFGWRRTSDGMRRFTESYEEVPRKNAKSTRLAARALFMFCADGEFGAEVYSGATSEKQAWEVFRPARDMVKRTPALKNRFDIEVNAKTLAIIPTGSRFEPIIGKPGDGASPHFCAVDEYHEHDSDALFDTMQTGMGAREQPMISVITTAGTNMAGPCYEKRRDICRILEGQVEDERTFGIIYGIDDEDRWDTVEAQIKANPNYGISVNADFLAGQLAKARRSAAKASSYRTKHLNQWVGARTAWMNMLAWQRQGKRMQLSDFAGCECHVGLDLASKTDLAALVFLVKREGDWFCIPRFYAPDAAAEANEQYRGWEQGGHLVLTPGNATDYGQIEADLVELAGVVDVRSIGFDEWQAQYMAQRLMDRGLPMVKFPHQVKTFSDPMKEIEAQVLERHLWHDKNPVMTWCISNTEARVDAKENIYPRKPNEAAKIDGTVALIMAMGRFLVTRDTGSIDDWLNDPVAI